MVLVLLLLAIGAMAAWSLIDPQSAWRASQGWMFRNASSVRLSGFAMLMHRALAALVLLVVIVTLVNL